MDDIECIDCWRRLPLGGFTQQGKPLCSVCASNDPESMAFGLTTNPEAISYGFVIELTNDENYQIGN